MSHANLSDSPVLGFFTVVQPTDDDFCGGLLLLNQHGHPLEFHCTECVRTNRAQQLLYGAALRPFLFGERIGRALISKMSVSPWALITDLPQVAGLAESSTTPVLLMLAAREESSGRPESAGESPPSGAFAEDSPANWQIENWGGYQLALSHQQREGWPEIQKQLSCFPTSFVLDEPFERIRGAIEEVAKVE